MKSTIATTARDEIREILGRLSACQQLAETLDTKLRGAAELGIALRRELGAAMQRAHLTAVVTPGGRVYLLDRQPHDPPTAAFCGYSLVLEDPSADDATIAMPLGART